MSKLTFILGGARSGKSTYAADLATMNGKKVAFIATCRPLDDEMKKRVNFHKSERPSHWVTFEEPRDPAVLLRKIGARFDLIIIDCLTLLITNLLMDDHDDAAIEKKIREMLEALASLIGSAIIVSNEVGLGIVPDNELSRRFRDLAGRIHQLVARKADTVVFMAAGLPLLLKGKNT